MSNRVDALKSRTIGLALSGGGIRAAIFHLGVLRYLAEHNLLERVKYISSVSGGSLLVGLLFRCSDYSWPSSEEFRTKIFEKVKCVLLGPNIQFRYIVRLFLLPWNWIRFAFRANIMAETISSSWDIHENLNQLPLIPVWAINGTTMETGRRWRFRNETTTAQTTVFEMGDGEIGYTKADDFPIASSMATSAAFPGGISPLRVTTHNRKWSLPDFSNLRGAPRNVKPKYCAYHVADGGVYDNLGLEPLYDISSGAIRTNSGCNYLIISDAGAPLLIRRWSWLSQIFGFSKRNVDIISSATRNLRIRDLVRFLIANSQTGIFINISGTCEDAIARARKRDDVCVPPSLENYQFQSNSVANSVANYKTTLSTPSETDFEMIERHGYEVAMVQFELYG